MTKFGERYRVESARKINWDYSTPGIYFITICTYNHINLLGKYVNNQFELKPAGKICAQCIKEIPQHFSNIQILESVIMPNHVHLLLELSPCLFNPVETHNYASLTKRYQSYFHHRIAIKSIQTIPLAMKMLKSSVKYLTDQNNHYFSWQPRFYDEIITNPIRLKTIKYYIKNNPKNWEKDKLYRV